MLTTIFDLEETLRNVPMNPYATDEVSLQLLIEEAIQKLHEVNQREREIFRQVGTLTRQVSRLSISNIILILLVVILIVIVWRMQNMLNICTYIYYFPIVSIDYFTINL